jgi:hypothetical protein
LTRGGAFGKIYEKTNFKKGVRFTKNTRFNSFAHLKNQFAVIQNKAFYKKCVF